jgi:two-component system, NarL family, invasion response regulator UvrY
VSSRALLFVPATKTVSYQVSTVKVDRTNIVGVMVVDDQPPFRRAARAVIDATEGFEAIGDAESGPKALHHADQLEPDLVLIDVHMPEMDGFETARRLTESHPECVVVLVSLDALELPASAVTACGAVAFVRKQELRPATLRSLWLVHGARG